MRLLKRRIIVAILSVAMAFTMFPLIGANNTYAFEGDLPDVGDGIYAFIQEDDLIFYVESGYDDECFLDPTAGGTDWEDFKNNELIAGAYKDVNRIFLGNGIYGIGEGFFEGMTNIDTIAIPETIGDYVTTGKGIHKDAFKGCDNITRLYYGGTRGEWDQVVSYMNLPEGNDAIIRASEAYCNDPSMKYTDVSKAKNTAFTRKYTGTWIRPIPNLTYNGEKLEKGFDFAVRYTKNKNVGKANIHVAGRNHFKGTRTVNFKIYPLGTYVKKVTSPAKKKIKVTWERQGRYMTQTRITGYQVKISRSKNFTKSTTSTAKVKGYSKLSKTFKVKKSHKRYYAKVRTYKVVNGVTYWSKWSKLKSRVSK